MSSPMVAVEPKLYESARPTQMLCVVSSRERNRYLETTTSVA